MSSTLVAYFSASGITAELARNLASVINADIYKIVPAQPYTDKDLDWTDRTSRSTVEMEDLNSRPKLADSGANVEDYDTIFLGFPIWWYREPSIIDTFLEYYDFSDKKIIPFCTSGGSAIGDTYKRIDVLTGGRANVDMGKRFSVNVSPDELKTWAEQYI